jgi:hypothetical protein
MTGSNRLNKLYNEIENDTRSTRNLNNLINGSKISSNINFNPKKVNLRNKASYYSTQDVEKSNPKKNKKIKEEENISSNNCYSSSLKRFKVKNLAKFY